MLQIFYEAPPAKLAALTAPIQPFPGQSQGRGVILLHGRHVPADPIVLIVSP